MNLLLVSVDSLRLDFVSRTNARIRTPRFDALSRTFCFSDRCFSVSSATRPVHTSLLTGLYPFEHSVTSQRTVTVRPGVAHLFALLSGRGFQVGAFSEAAGIFAGLDYASWISAYDPGWVLSFLGTRDPKFLFVHYWGCHTPYGAPDGRALGDTAQRLREGGRQEVIRRYQRAVQAVFEAQIAPLLERVDLGQWMVLICGDHGESWTAEEPYHGQTLENTVLRVPLYLHLPHTGDPALPGALVSLVDVFPTVAAVLGLDSGYRGYGRDLRHEERPKHYLAQIHPAGALTENPGGEPEGGGGTRGAQWALFDAHRKFTYWEESGASRLERTLSGERVPCEDADLRYYREAFAGMVANSGYAHLAPAPGAGPSHLLDQRLHELGYL